MFLYGIKFEIDFEATFIKQVLIDGVLNFLTLYFIMLQNGQTYFKNLAVWTLQDF